MFKSLRNKLIWINLGITTAVIIISFTFIYLFATHSAQNRPPIEPTYVELENGDFENTIKISLNHEREAAARDLLIILIVAGISIEIIVALVSYFLAEESIKPIREAYESQKIFIANASHEIKTPLAAISANLEAADIKNNKWIKNIEKETAKLTNLNNELLTLARTDLQNSNIAKEEINIKTYINTLLESYESRLTNINLKTRTKSIKVKINATDFAQIFNILLDNAIKYCDKSIEISANEHELTILNDGVTIKQDDLSHIFDRFYQVDKSSDGVGLGLSIAKATADKNHWQLKAESKNHTTKFIILFN